MAESQETPWYRKYLVSVVAGALVLTTYGLSRYPAPSAEVLLDLASRFDFEKRPFPETASPDSFKGVRKVAPDLERISAWVSSLGAAVSLADLDGDGMPNDVCSVDPRTDLVSVFPAPGTPDRFPPFVLDPGSLPFDAVTTAPMGTLLGDFDEDGGADVLVYYWGRTPILFMRNPPTAAAGPLSRSHFTATELTDSGERWFTNALTQGDLDGDGHLDLVVGNYFKDGARILDPSSKERQSMHEGKSSAFNGGRNHFFLWKSKATPGTTSGFVEVNDVVSDHLAYAWTLAAGAVDLDGDLLPELYFGNDFGPDWLLHNESTPGTLKFSPLRGHRSFLKPKSCVLGSDSFKGMGCDFADLNNDGFPDIYVSNIATRFGLTESHFVWMSTGETGKMKEGQAPYVQESESLGLSRSGWGWDCRLADFDNDGVLEAIQACGFVKGSVNRWPELQSLGTSNDAIVSNPKLWPTFRPGADLSGHDWNPFFVRGANGRYSDIAPELGLDQPMVSKGIAIADVDGDGRLDYAVANQWEDSYLFLNRSKSAGKSIVLNILLPAAGQPDLASGLFDSFEELEKLRTSPAIGAAVTVELPDGTRRVGHADGGSGHSGQRSSEVHLGLGEMGPAETVGLSVKWRDRTGRVRTWPEGGGQESRIKPGRYWLLLGNPAGTE